MRPLPISKKWIVYPLIILVVLSLATPALADYLGPNRTVTETIGGACKVVLNECQYVPAKNDYRYKNVDDWSCANESKPWQAYPNEEPRACTKNSVGDQYWSREEGTQTVITTHPAATITGSLQNCTLQNGWCGGAIPQLTLDANEPLSGYSILLIEGLLNGDTFACPAGAASCSVPLAEGDNNLAYWALSSWGDSSTMGTWTARVDTVPPDVSLDVSGANGANGWYVSPVSITATGSDSTSGLASALLSVDSGARQASVTLNEGVYKIDVTASDYAGNTSSASTTFAVDTTTPALNVAVDGTPGRNGWYRSTIEVSAVAQDATSGIATFEASIDGAAFQAYSSSVSFSDGPHSIQYRAMDRAGNQTEIPVQKFYVDTIAPDIELPGIWQLGKNVPYAVTDAGSGLATLRIVIEDEDERYAKVAWDEKVSGGFYSQDINWNGQFKDKTNAAPGTYLVWIKAADAAGNERIKLGKVIVPEPNVILGLFQPEEIPADTPLPPEDLYSGEVSEEWVSPPVSDFGNTTTVPTEITNQSLLLATGTAGSIPIPTSNVLWGAAAAAVIGAATSYALDERRKREEAIARQAAEAAEQRERDEKKRADKLQKQQENWLAAQALEHSQQPTWTHAPTDGKVGRQEWDESLDWMREQADAKRRAFPGLFPSISKEIKVERLEVEQGMDWIIKNAEIEHFIHEQKTEDIGMRLQTYRDASSAGPKKAPDPESNYWEKFKYDVNCNIIQPLKTAVYDPFIKPLVEINNEIAERQQLWWDRNVYWRHIYPAKQDLKQAGENFSKAWDEDVYQPLIKPIAEKIAAESREFKEEIYQPTIKPFIEQTLQNLAKDFAPLAKSFNENFYQPHLQPAVDKINAGADQFTNWVNEKIYYPYLDPIDRDISKYVVQPSVRKAKDWWEDHGEWVHGALDVVGFIPAFGEIADGINGLIYLAEGRYLEAGLSAMSMIPFADIGKAGKLAIKASKEVAETVVGKLAKETLEAGSEALFKEAKEELVEQFVKEGQEALLTGSIRETGEEVVEKVTKEALDEGAEKFFRQVGEGAASKTFKEGFQETTEKTVARSQKELREDVFEQRLVGKQNNAGITIAKQDAIVEQITPLTHREVDKELVRRILDDVVEGKVTKLPIDVAQNLTHEGATELATKISGELGGKKVWVSSKTGSIYVSSPPIEGFRLAEELSKIDLTKTDEVEKILKEVAELTSRGSGKHAVLGPFRPNGRFIQEALDTDGVFWDVGDELWEALEKTGIDMFKANDQFIHVQIERNIGRFDIIGESVDDVIAKFNSGPPQNWHTISYTRKEILDLVSMPDLPYKRVGNSWFRIGSRIGELP